MANGIFQNITTLRMQCHDPLSWTSQPHLVNEFGIDQTKLSDDQFPDTIILRYVIEQFLWIWFVEHANIIELRWALTEKETEKQ